MYGWNKAKKIKRWRKKFPINQSSFVIFVLLTVVISYDIDYKLDPVSQEKIFFIHLRVHRFVDVMLSSTLA